jgi:hypothetical protein
LPEGVVVEIVGVSEHPSKGKPWWAANGAPIAAPYDHVKTRVGGYKEITREIAYRIVEPKNASITWEFEPSGSSGEGRPFDAEGKIVKDLRICSRAFPLDLQTCSLKVGIATGPWKSFARSSGNYPQSMGILNHGFAFSPAYVSDGAIVVSFADNIHDLQVRLVAMGPGDKPLAVGNGRGCGAANFTLRTVSFPNLKLDDVEGFQVEARPYRWFEITGISLHPAKTTEPKLVERSAEAKWHFENLIR